MIPIAAPEVRDRDYARRGGKCKSLVENRLKHLARSPQNGERSARVFIVATANDLARLPAERLRKGRFDEIFFVDLPTEVVRRAIFTIHLAKRGDDADRFDLDALVAASDAFSGAEIEQVVVAAQYEVHATGSGLDTAILVAGLRGTRPLSVVRAEEIEALRSWAAERTVAVD